MSECNSALQTEKDLFEREIQQNLLENCQISALFVPKKIKNVNFNRKSVKDFSDFTQS